MSATDWSASGMTKSNPFEPPKETSIFSSEGPFANSSETMNIGKKPAKMKKVVEKEFPGLPSQPIIVKAERQIIQAAPIEEKKVPPI